jgi:hypothetical protein
LTRREAQAFEVTERTNRLSNAWIDSRRAKTPLATVSEDWLESDARKRARSIERDRGILANHILPVLGSKPVGAISRADVQRLVRSWTGRYARIHRRASVLNASSGAGLRRGQRAHRPLTVPPRPLPQATPREAEILDGDGMERLAAAMGTYGPRLGDDHAGLTSPDLRPSDRPGRPPSGRTDRRAIPSAGWTRLALSSVRPSRPLTCCYRVGAGGLDPPTSAL